MLFTRQYFNVTAKLTSSKRMGLCDFAEVMTLYPATALNMKEYFRMVLKWKQEKEHRAGDIFRMSFLLFLSLNKKDVQKLSAKPSFLNIMISICQLIHRYTMNRSFMSRRRREGSGKQAYFALYSFVFLKH